jgi:hypothetical protein
MAVKKSSAAKTAANKKASNSDSIDNKPIVTEEEKSKPNITSKKPKKQTDNVGSFCVYIGPSIRGVIQSGTVYSGSLKKTLDFLSPAIKKFPLIAKLISTEKTIAEDRIKVKTAGNLLNVYYRKLANGKYE